MCSTAVLQPLPYSQVMVHPAYNEVYNDIALIRLTEPIDFEETGLTSICLPTNQKFNDSVEKGVVAGWGSIRDPHCTTDGKNPHDISL